MLLYKESFDQRPCSSKSLIVLDAKGSRVHDELVACQRKTLSFNFGALALLHRSQAVLVPCEDQLICKILEFLICYPLTVRMLSRKVVPSENQLICKNLEFLVYHPLTVRIRSRKVVPSENQLICKNLEFLVRQSLLLKKE